jgi:hypothetical protein
MAKQHTGALFAVLGSVLAVILIVWLLFTTLTPPKDDKTRLVVLVGSEGCKEGTSCKSCIERNDQRTCREGICSARGECILPAQGNTTRYPESGLRAMVLS